MSKFLAEFLKVLREDAGITQHDLSVLLTKSGKSYSTTYISKLENGLTIPSLKLIIRLSHIYECDVNKLLSLRRKDYLDKINIRLNEEEAKALNKEKQKIA